MILTTEEKRIQIYYSIFSIYLIKIEKDDTERKQEIR